MITAFLNVMRVGSVVANPEAWKKGQVTADMIGGLVLAFGSLANSIKALQPITQHITPEFASALGLVILTVVSPLLTVATSAKVGILPAKDNPNSVDNPVPGVNDVNGG